MRRVQESAWGRRWVDRCPQAEIIDIGAHVGPPVLEFGSAYAAFLVEVAHDPYFYLAGGMFGSGRTWTVGPELFKSLGPRTYYFRVVDISGPKPRLIGVYRYRRVAAHEAEAEVETEEAQLG
jgi:hypothetical protein